jgi:hypothetical protein
MNWVLFDERYPPEQLAVLNGMLSVDDPRPACEQLGAGYAQFGGWRPMPGFSMLSLRLKYPGDPPLPPWALTTLRNEAILVYPGDWVVILQKDKSFEVCRMD